MGRLLSVSCALALLACSGDHSDETGTPASKSDADGDAASEIADDGATITDSPRDADDICDDAFGACVCTYWPDDCDSTYPFACDCSSWDARPAGCRGTATTNCPNRVILCCKTSPLP